MPKVEVDGVGVLSFPVPPTQIAALVQHATHAPYGRGEETILDESVRRVWQLPPNKVRLGGKSWASNLDGILKQVTAGLGCEGMAGLSFAGLKSVSDLAEAVMQCSDRHRPGSDFVFVVYDIHDSLSLVIVQSPLGHEQ